MNSSAKVTLSIFIAAALGAVGFACTVGSTTDNNFDGGTRATSSSSSSGSTTSSSSSGAVADGGLCPQSNQDLEPASCNTCVRTNCCEALAGCFNIPDEPVDGGKVGCRNYTECISSCADQTPTDQAKIDQCTKDICDLAAVGSVPPAYKTFASCRDTKCPDCP